MDNKKRQAVQECGGGPINGLKGARTWSRHSRNETPCFNFSQSQSSGLTVAYIATKCLMKEPNSIEHLISFSRLFFFQDHKAEIPNLKVESDIRDFVKSECRPGRIAQASSVFLTANVNQ